MATKREKQRGKGEGSIRERKDGTWEARYTVGVDSNGKQIQKSVYAKTKPDIVKKLNAKLSELYNGTYQEPSKLTVAQWLEFWLYEHKKHTVSAVSFDRYENSVRNHLNPAIGNIKLEKLNTLQIQKVYNQMSTKYKRATMDLTHRTLHMALEFAVKTDTIPKNPAQFVELPKERKEEVEVLTREQQKTFMEHCQSERLGSLLAMALMTGLRQGELAALTWDDVKDGVVNVNKTLTITKNREDEGRKRQLNTSVPKTDSSNRTVPIMPDLQKVLDKHRVNQLEEKLKAGAAYNDNNLLFCSPKGELLYPNNLNLAYKRVLKKAGIPAIKFHALRHTFATRCLEAEIDMKIVQKLLGHSSMTMTADIYSHVLPDQTEQAIEKLSAFLQ